MQEAEGTIMPTLSWNLQQWNKHYGWSAAGDAWSAVWSSANHECFGTLLPRIHPYLPAQTILEIPPGYGRWTQYLKDCCTSVSEMRKVQIPRARFLRNRTCWTRPGEC